MNKPHLTVVDDYVNALLDDVVPVEVAPVEAAPVEVAPIAPVVPVAAVAPVPPVAANHEPPPVATLPRVSAPQRWLRVAVGEDSYAFELLRVRVAPMVAMRGADRAVLGVMNLRGRILPVFDLGLWLETAAVRTDERSRIVVVGRDDELIGVLVSGVDDVVVLGRDRIEPPLLGTRHGAILGIARVGAVPTVLLDSAPLFG